MRLRIDLAYDGAPFYGFARQPDHPTVQGVLEDALARLLDLESAETTCTGRTDRGVHALAQTVHIDVPDGWAFADNLDHLRYTLDKMVGTAITIWRVRRVPATFDARFSALQRRYRYRLWEGAAMPPLLAHDTFHVGPPLDVEAMDRAARPLVGTHDFTSFCRRRLLRGPDGRQVEGTLVRRIDRLTIRRSRPKGLVILRIDGKAFCHTMVRAITGSLVEVGRHRQPEPWIGELLAAQDRTFAGPVAPPHGLCLVGVTFSRSAPPPYGSDHEEPT